MALIILVLSGLIVGPFLSYGSTALIASRVNDRLIEAQYAAGAGAEDAIWNLVYGDFTTTVVVDENDTYNYILNNTVDGQVDDPVNNLLPDITVTKVSAYLARDNFETDSFAGGTGWQADWQTTGGADVTPNYLPYEGSFHLQLKSGDESAKRSIDLSGKSSIHLQFYAKANSFEPGDEAICQISSNGVDWTTVQSWVDGDDDNIYYFYDIDLSSYAPYTSGFWIMFDANMDAVNDWIFFDDVVIKFVTPGAIIMPADDFETGTFTGGVGWLGDWTAEANADVIKQGNPHEGQYHLEMSRADSDVQRSADLAGQSGLSVQFWAKVDFFQTGKTVQFQVSNNGVDWTMKKTWDDTDNDDNYHYFDIDLSSHAPYSSTFWFRFESGMNHNNDHFYVDAFQVTGGGAGVGADAEYYDIISVAGSIEITSTVTIDSGVLGIISWQIN